MIRVVIAIEKEDGGVAVGLTDYSVLRVGRSPAGAGISLRRGRHETSPMNSHHLTALANFAIIFACH